MSGELFKTQKCRMRALTSFSCKVMKMHNQPLQNISESGIWIIRIDENRVFRDCICILVAYGWNFDGGRIHSWFVPKK